MTRVIGVNFRENGKVYFFKNNDLELKVGDNVIVETKLGKELGIVRTTVREIDETKLEEPVKEVIKIASKEDRKHHQENRKKEKEAFKICEEKIKEHKLEMNLVETKYLFDNTKLVFYFTAENRIDFRELVKDLAAIFKTRIELRQISIRDQVKRLGGNGICGRELCCCSFLNKFENVSIKMAKEQNLSLNVSKIAGNCGRLMCCLKYEQNVYEDKMKKLPHPGAIVKTKDGEGTIDTIEVLREIARVKLKDENDNNYFRKYPVEEIEVIKDTKKKQTDNTLNIDTKEDLKELEKIEEMDKRDKKNANSDDE